MRQRLLLATDRVLAATLFALVLGSGLCFGGAVWWFPPALCLVAFLMVASRLAHCALEGRFAMLKSPLTLLGLLTLALGLAQSVALPAPVARRISPAAQEVWTTGSWSRLVQADDPAAKLPPAMMIRSPATLDRAATLVWMVRAACLLAIFWTASHFVDRLGRLYWLLGSVLAVFLVNTAFGIVQIGGDVDGLFGVIVPGRGAAWAPSADDLLATPTPAPLRRLDAGAADNVGATAMIAPVPERPFLLGTMMGGPGALLAIGSMALPIGLGLLIHLFSPRGSRESLGDRLAPSGLGSLAALLLLLLPAGAFLAGMLSGPWFCLPFAVALGLVGLAGMVTPGVRWTAAGLTSLMLAALALGAATVAVWPTYLGDQPPVAPISWEATNRLWVECLPILRDFPLIGTGLGTFPTIHAYFQTQDIPDGPAMSSALRWIVESGWAGIALVALASAWAVVRLPFVLRRVGSADRALALGLIGAGVGFILWSTVHWTIELPAVAIAAAALGGACNRWLSGGTDLFVERA